MNKEKVEARNNQKKTRISKSEKSKLQGQTNWAALVAEERKENPKK